MLNASEMDKIRELSGFSRQFQEVHYLQSTMLFLMKDVPMVFKGGTCLWFFFGLPRFSEDLDFTASGDINDNLPDKLVNKLASQFGIKSKIVERVRDDTAFEFIIDSVGPYYVNPQTVVKISSEISWRERVQLSPLPAKFDHPEYKIPVSIISCMRPQEIACEKVRALITRKKARDLFDLWYLISEKGVVFDEKMINVKLSLPVRKIGGEKLIGKRFSLKEFQEKIAEKESRWIPDLRPVVIGKIPKFDKCARIVFNWARNAC